MPTTQNPSTTIDIVRVTWSLQDDIVYKKPALALYATGCSWKCKGCHNKELWDFKHPDNKKYAAAKLIKYITLRQDYLPARDITIVGMGGDFWFQLDSWLAFTQEVKAAFPEIKILWYTGANYELKPDKDLTSIDAILWGNLTSRDGKVYKTLTESSTNHSNPGETFVNEYDPSHEGTDPSNTNELKELSHATT